jgi:ubiquinone/menaquinone biosynthesis C-methylase UbiE
MHGDMHALPLHNAAVDGCMFLYSLCHADPVRLALQEAARVTKPGGGLFVFDYARLAGDNRLMQEKLYAAALPPDCLRAIAEAVGWHVTGWDAPDGDDALFRELYGNPVEYALIFTALVPVLWRAVRR